MKSRDIVYLKYGMSLLEAYSLLLPSLIIGRLDLFEAESIGWILQWVFVISGIITIVIANNEKTDELNAIDKEEEL